MKQVLKVDSEQRLILLSTEMFHILINLRDKTKKWNEFGGYENREGKKYWEKRADEFLKENLFVSET